MRPDITTISTSAEFLRWYWLKEEMIEICKAANLSYIGGKFELRDRIAYALDHNGDELPQIKKKPKSKFNWAKEPLSLETIITDSVTFGPNFKRFMQSQIGEKYKASIPFMDWVKANVGTNLAAVVQQWHFLEKRKNDPDFESFIPSHNMLNQYVRDFLESNPNLRFKDALKCWHYKRRMPMEDGLVKYDATDLKQLKSK